MHCYADFNGELFEVSFHSDDTIGSLSDRIDGLILDKHYNLFRITYISLKTKVGISIDSFEAFLHNYNILIKDTELKSNDVICVKEVINWSVFPVMIYDRENYTNCKYSKEEKLNVPALKIGRYIHYKIADNSVNYIQPLNNVLMLEIGFRWPELIYYNNIDWTLFPNLKYLKLSEKNSNLLIPVLEKISSLQIPLHICLYVDCNINDLSRYTENRETKKMLYEYFINNGFKIYYLLCTKDPNITTFHVSINT